MTIADLLRDKIEAFASDLGRPPALIKLGRLQMRELDTFRSKYISTVAPSLDYANFDGVRIDAVDHDDLIEVADDD